MIHYLYTSICQAAKVALASSLLLPAIATVAETSVIATVEVTPEATIEPIAENRAATVPTQQLIELLKPLVNSAGKFEQVAKDSSGEIIQSSSGHFAVQKPGKFLWHTSTPFEQVLVSDGETIWLYNPDLEQVTVKPFNSGQDQLPIRILSGEFNLLSTEFEIQYSAKNTTYLLTPIKTDAISHININFDGEELVAMTVQDPAQTTTQFLFSDRRALTDLDKKVFDFNIPTGADVFYDQ